LLGQDDTIAIIAEPFPGLPLVPVASQDRPEFADQIVALDGDPLSAADRFSRGRGIDGAIVTAATKSHEPIQQAARMCRKRGRIVLVGVTGMELSREEFYKKELSFQVSCSYGPGRHDPSYEDKGYDYPIGYVRWTEQRNFEAVLDAMADGRLQVEPLVSHRFGLEDAGEAYDVVATRQPSLGLLFEYPTAKGNSADGLRTRRVVIGRDRVEDRSTTSPGVAFVGSGGYATGALMPAFKAAGARLVSVVSSTGISAMHAGRRFGFREATTDAAMALDDPAVQALVIATRHDSHAELVLESLRAGKAIFVEKPLCLTLEELVTIEATYARSAHPLVMIGFNRRFAPQVRRIKALLESSGPKSFVMTVNAGAVALDHWTQDREVGGGRIIGEACHFIDLLRFLAGFPIVDQGRVAMSSRSGDTQTIHLRFQDGSIGTVHYFANGTRAFPKERLEVFSDGRVLQLDNFRKLRAFGWPGFTRMNLWRQDKGQRACATAFLDAVRSGGPSPIPFDEIVEVSRTAIALA
jgi:predicted dehydrogenase